MQVSKAREDDRATGRALHRARACVCVCVCVEDDLATWRALQLLVTNRTAAPLDTHVYERPQPYYSASNWFPRTEYLALRRFLQAFGLCDHNSS